MWISRVAALALASSPAVSVAGPVSPSETRAENERQATLLHQRLDANHDGFVTYDEIRSAALKWVMPKGKAVPLSAIPDLPTARTRFDRADTDHDGRLSLAEEIAGADAEFDKDDANHDGLLSADERGAAIGKAVDIEIQDLRAIPPAAHHTP